MKLKFFPLFKDEGEVVAAWGEAQLIKYLDEKTELRGGSEQEGAGQDCEILLSRVSDCGFLSQFERCLMIQSVSACSNPIS